MKKMLWLTILIAIVAVVLVSVFVIQRNSLSTEVTRLQASNNELNQQLTEVDMAVKTAQELAETMVHEAEEKLTAVTAERDSLQAENEAKTAGIKQVQTVLGTLVGDETALQLQETQEALTAMTAERDALQSSLDEAKAAVETLAAVTAERDALQTAVENAKLAEKAQVLVLLQDETVLEADDLGQLNLDQLPAGVYTVKVRILNAAGEQAAEYSFPYTAAEQEAPVAEEAAPETAEAEQPAAEAAETEQPAAEGAEEEPAAPEEADPDAQGQEVEVPQEPVPVEEAKDAA